MSNPLAPTPTRKVFPVKSITIDTFDGNLNGINEHTIRFEEPIPLALDDPNETYSELLRKFAQYLIGNVMITLDENTSFFQIKTNVFKKVAISCLVDTRSKEKTDGTIEGTTTGESEVDGSNN